MCCTSAQYTYDTRHQGYQCPFNTLKSPSAFLSLPVKLRTPTSVDSISSVPNTVIEEFNAKLRVGFKLMGELREAVEVLTNHYRSDTKLIKAFKTNQFDKKVMDALFSNLGNKVRHFHFIMRLSHSLAEFLTHDCAP